MNKPSIYFYYPNEITKADLPGFKNQYKGHRGGNYFWTAQTYKYLKDSGFEVTIRMILDNNSAHISKETRSYLSAIPGRFKFIFTPTHGS